MVAYAPTRSSSYYVLKKLHLSGNFTCTGLVLNLDAIDFFAFNTKADGTQRAAKSAAAIDGGAEWADLYPPMFRVKATYNFSVPTKGRIEAGKVGAVPPKCIALSIERALGINAGMDEKKRSFLGKSSPS